MTQASLSTDLQGALGAPPSVRDTPGRSDHVSEAALWMTALTSSALVIAAVLMFSLLASSNIGDASMGGFVSAIGVVIVALGVGGMAYVLVTARRAGYLATAEASSAADSVVPAGMHVVPALPSDLGSRKRRQLEAERSARNRQAKAIATAAAATAPTARPATAPTARPATPTHPAPRPVVPTRPAPRPSQDHVVRAVPMPGARPLPPRLMPQARPPARLPAPVRAAITMPQPHVHALRPAAWPNRAPVVRMATPPMRPRTQVATFQVNAANVRPAASTRPR